VNSEHILGDIITSLTGDDIERDDIFSANVFGDRKTAQANVDAIITNLTSVQGDGSRRFVVLGSRG